MSKNNLASVINAAYANGKQEGSEQTLKNLMKIVDEERSNIVECQYCSEYNRGYVDGLSKAYMYAIDIAKKGGR